MTIIEERVMRTILRDLPRMTESLETIVKHLETKECCICGKQFKEHGNSAFPVKEGICCDKCCWTVVLAKRFELTKGISK